MYNKKNSRRGNAPLSLFNLPMKLTSLMDTGKYTDFD